MRFYHAKLDFSAQITDNSSSNDVGGRAKTIDTLTNYFETSGPATNVAGSDWRFGNYKRDDNVIAGRFGRLYEDEPTTFDEDSEDFDKSDPMEVADVSWFIVDTELKTIAFNQRQKIGYNQFVRAFSKGYNSFAGISNALKMPFLTPRDEIERIFRETEVKSVNFDLEPTNPFPTDEFEDVDDELKAMNAEEGDISFDGGDEGLSAEESSLLSSLLAFGQSPYGDVNVVYQENGEIQEYSTKDKPAMSQIPSPSSLDNLLGNSRPILDRAQELV